MNNEPKTLYHYTDANGLRGILEQGEIWCSHIHFLNDAQEHLIGQSLYREMLTELAERRPIDPIDLALAESALMYLKFSNYLQPRGVFVASFTTEDDDLSQWRGYSSTGSRYCIEFDFMQLSSISKPVPFKIGEINYDNVSTKNTMRDMFETHGKALIAKHRKDGYHRDNPRGWVSMDYLDINNAIIPLGAPLLKHQSLKKEKEWRLYSTEQHTLDSKEISFRVGRSFLIPFVKVKITDLKFPIVSIRCGPGPHPEHARRAVEMLKQSVLAKGTPESLKLFRNDFEVKRSDIPYRDW